MKSRIQYIDMAKGLTILLVIVGHIDTVNVLEAAIYSFHMPMFFILSGYFMKIQLRISEAFKKLFRTLIVTYLVVGGQYQYVSF